MMIVMVRIKTEKKMDRWYSVSVQPTLLDPWAVVCAWGNRHTNYLQTRILSVESPEAGKEIATSIIAKKVHRGYSIIVYR